MKLVGKDNVNGASEIIVRQYADDKYCLMIAFRSSSKGNNVEVGDNIFEPDQLRSDAKIYC